MTQQIVRVRVPATTANLGSGFDTLGMALSLYNDMEARISDHPHITVVGEGAGRLPCSQDNLICRAMRTLADAVGKRLPPVALHLRNGIPLSSGLGSSAAAIVGGLLAANALLGAGLSTQRLLELANDMEGHPDNVAPCLFGGLTMAFAQADRVHCLRALPTDEFTFLALIPPFGLPTHKARAALPPSYSRTDAVRSVGRALLMYAALRDGHAAALRDACADALHQPYRAPLIAGYEQISALAYAHGALGVCLSGAGPTLLAVYDAYDRAGRQRLQAALADHEPPWQALPLTCCATGAVILHQ